MSASSQPKTKQNAQPRFSFKTSLKFKDILMITIILCPPLFLLLLGGGISAILLIFVKRLDIDFIFILLIVGIISILLGICISPLIALIAFFAFKKSYTLEIKPTSIFIKFSGIEMEIPYENIKSMQIEEPKNLLRKVALDVKCIGGLPSKAVIVELYSISDLPLLIRPFCKNDNTVVFDVDDIYEFMNALAFMTQLRQMWFNHFYWQWQKEYSYPMPIYK